MRNFLNKLYRFSSSWTGTFVIVFVIIFFIAQAFIIPSASMQNSLLIGDFLFAKKFSYGIPIPRLPIVNWPVLPDLDGDGHIINGDKPQRGDIVIFLEPKKREDNFVKRCFATGGDEVIYADDTFFLHPKEGDEYIKANFDEAKIKTFMGKLWVENPYIGTYPGIHYESVNTDENLMTQGTLTASDKPSPFLMMTRIAHTNLKNQLGMKPVLIDELPKYNAIYFNAFYTKVEENSYFMIGDNRDNSQDSRFFGSVPYELIIGKPWFIYFSWDENKIPRWERMFKSVSSLELQKFENIRY